jgi:ATP-binding cassette subfamily B protein RaxB
LIRARLLTYAQRTLAFQMGKGLFRHLLRLPMSYFEKRHVGDLVSRFASTEPVRASEGLVIALIDGTMALLTAAKMFFIAPPWDLSCLPPSRSVSR